MINFPDVSIEQLKAFVAVAQLQSFSLAAKELFRTQSAVSVQVAKLEEVLGHQLFARTSKSIVLTQAGDLYLEHVKAVFQTLDEASQALLDLNDRVSGKLVITTSDTTACYRMPKLIKRYRKSFPDVEIIIRNATSLSTIESIISGEADLGVATLRNIPEILVTKALYERGDCLICHPDHPLAKRKSVLLKDLESYPVVLLDRNCASRRILDLACEKAKVTLQPSMELSSIEVVKSLVKINSGISIVPKVSVQDDVKQGLLKVLKIEKFAEDEVPIGLVYQKNRYQNSATLAFIDLCLRTSKINYKA